MRSCRFHIIVLGLLLLMAGCQRPIEDVQVHYVPCADMPSPRASACACTLGDKAYIFGGRDSAGNYLKDVWEYNSKTDSWTSVSIMPGLGRVNPTAVVVDGLIYVGMGFVGGSPYDADNFYTDWWRFDPTTNQWKMLSDHISQNTNAATTYYENDTIYVIYGGWGMATRELYTYTISSDKWKKIPYSTNRPTKVFKGVGTTCQHRHFFGTGFTNTDNISSWYEVHLSQAEFTQKTPIPGKGRSMAAVTATNDYIYLFGGRYFAGDLTGGEVFDTYMRYLPNKDVWEWCGQMPQRAENLIAFTIQGHAYFGLGEDENGKLINKLYRIE